jgi:hypothetical protein
MPSATAEGSSGAAIFLILWPCPRPRRNPCASWSRNWTGLVDWELPEEIHEAIWTLLMDVQEFRRRQGGKDAPRKERTRGE